MKIPEWVDKWVVFGLVLFLGIDDLARSTGAPIGPLEYVLVPLMMAAMALLIFLLWRTMCRLVARMFRVDSKSSDVRGISNAVFFTALALMILQPVVFPGLFKWKVTVELPKEVRIK